MTCTTCGEPVEVGTWPWCPHGKAASGVIPDDIPGGLVMDHVEPGRKVYSRTELKQVLAAHGMQLTQAGRHDGRTKDKYLSRWV
jgi:hypothetical protein